MSELKYEGDTSGLSERQLEFVSGVFKNRGFKNETVHVCAVGKADDNFVANVKRFAAEKDGSTFKIVAKIAPTNAIMREKMQTKVMFHNEHFMYTEVLPQFSELEKSADISENNKLKYAACYGSLYEEPNEIILLEDLQVSGFIMLDKFKSLTDAEVKLVLKNFAILHSLSYALKNQDPETYEMFKSTLTNSWTSMEEMEGIKQYFGQLEEDVISILDNDEHKKLIRGSIIDVIEVAAKNYKIDKDSKYSVIQQGDSWTNNILFKLQADKTAECCMIDYQLSNHNSPVADLHYMIFNCTDYEARSKHYHEWIDYYHDQLDECLTRFGLTVNVIYPRDQLDADLKRLGKLFYGISVMLASMIMRDTHEAANFKEAMQDDFNMEELRNLSKLSSMDTSSSVRFRARVVGLLTSFIELGYL